ncbi:MAG: hypothetical protein DRQ62_10540 [Gammaproteobacteria bacterium]|nr:MAG: hypothetical protein DRQ62_10540 [Gammaproteobacteria bacterium]
MTEKLKIRALSDHVLVTGMNFRERISRGGLVLLSDDKKSEGIRPRWGKVIAIGPDQHDITVGQFIMVAHGRWTRGVEINGEAVRRVDNNDILLVSDKERDDETFGISD